MDHFTVQPGDIGCVRFLATVTTSLYYSRGGCGAGNRRHNSMVWLARVGKQAYTYTYTSYQRRAWEHIRISSFYVACNNESTIAFLHLSSLWRAVPSSASGDTCTHGARRVRRRKRTHGWWHKDRPYGAKVRRQRTGMDPTAGDTHVRI